MHVAADLGREASLRAMWRALYAASCCVETESEIGGVTNVAQWFDYAPYGSVIATTNTGTTKAARQYIGQFTDDFDSELFECSLFQQWTGAVHYTGPLVSSAKECNSTQAAFAARSAKIFVRSSADEFVFIWTR